MKFNNLLWGIVLVIVGIIFGLNALDITNINIFFEGWWTLFIIVPCLIDLFTEREKTGNIIGLVIGGSLFLACQDFISFDLILKLILPFIIIMFGLSLVFKDMNFNLKQEKIKVKKNNLKEHCVTFSKALLNYNNEEFKGCELTAVFGGIECNLENSIIKEDVYLEVTSIFGGIDIKVPKDINVKVTQTAIFGGVSNSKYQNYKNFKYTIYINVNCVFGGVEIK